MNTMSDWLVINIESLEKNGTIMTTTAVSPVIMRHFFQFNCHLNVMTVDSGRWTVDSGGEIRMWDTVLRQSTSWESVVGRMCNERATPRAAFFCWTNIVFIQILFPTTLLSPPPFLLPHLQYWDREDLTSSQQIWVNFKQWMRTHQNQWASIKHPEFTVHIQTMQASSLFVWSVIAWNINKYLLFRFLMRGCTSHPVILPPHD